MKKLSKILETVAGVMVSITTVIWVAAFIVAVFMGTFGGAIQLTRWVIQML